MRNFEKEIMMKITLNRMGYDHQDVEALIIEPFGEIFNTKVDFKDYESASGQDLIKIELIATIALAGIVTTLASKLTSDLYDWSKNVLRKVLHNKNQFIDSQVIIVFSDVKFIIYTNEKEEILETVENIDRVTNLLAKKYIEDDEDNKFSIGVDFYDEFKGKL